MKDFAGNTPQAIKPPNYSRVQKPHNQRKAPNPSKPTRQPRNPLKTPLKRETGHNIGLLQESKCSKEDKRQGTHRKSNGRLSNPAPPAPGGRDHRPKRRVTRQHLQPSKLKYILIFARFGLRKSRENTKHLQKIIYFCPFLLKICPDRLKIDIRRG